MKSCSITFGLLLLAGVAAAQWTPHADAILTNGSVVSVDDDFSIYEAVAIKDGRIIALGATDAVLTHRGDDTHVSDLEGRVVIPGLQDSHIHFLGLGHDVAYEVELSYAESAAEIVDAVRRVKKRRRLAPGEWLTGRRWDQYKYPEMVTRWQLDAVTPDNPVAIYRVYRGVAVNRRCCTARSKSLTSLCRLQSHPAQYVSGIPSAAILLSISHPIRCSTRCLANVRARISGPMIAL